MRRTLHYVALLALLAPACSDDDDTGAVDGDQACVQTLTHQPRDRFPVGTTFWVSGPLEGCETTWSVTLAPSGSANEIVAGADGFVRFTPDVPGEYAFASEDGATDRLTVIDSATAPFHHVNYYGGDSVAFVGDEVWTANVFSPTLTRMAPDDLASRGQIAVGPWPVALAWHAASDTVWVAQRGSDTVGIVDVASGRIVDALWVGDEPANIVIGQQTDMAYVALANEQAVAVIDVDARSVVGRYDVEPDPFGIALSPDETLLAVASRRTGQAERFPYADTDPADERDIVILDAASGDRRLTLIDVGTTINGVRFSADGASLFVANTTNDTEADQVDGDVFSHELVRYDVASGEMLARADLGLQDTSGGYAVFVYAPAVDGDTLWVPAQGSDVVLELDANTLEERARYDATGRPRAVVARDGVAWVHGEQAFAVTRVPSGGAPITGGTGVDPRPVDVAEGQAFFTGAGRSYGESWGCHGCHVDGLTDTLVWRVGPFPEYEVPRPIFWTEGTTPLGWTAYVSSPEAFALAGPVNVGVRTVTEEAETLGAYLASIMPPPPATGHTSRDGELSAAALRGRELFEGRAGCVGCHAGPTGTNRAVFADGITPGRTDVPSMVSIARFGVWLKDGSAQTLEDAVREALAFVGTDDQLTDAEVADLARYLMEWTAREFFVLTSEPADGEPAAPIDEPIVLTFSHPVWDASDNLAQIELLDEQGAVLPADVVVDGRYVTLTPDRLDHEAAYRVRVGAEVESFGARRTGDVSEIEFTTASAPALTLEGEYVLTFQVPTIDVENERLDPTVVAATPLDVVASPTASGATLEVDLLLDLSQTVRAVADGSVVRIEPIAIPAGPFALGDSSGLVGTLVDDDGDGVADRIDGGTTVFSGPGFLEDIAWTFERRAEVGACDPGTSGDVTVSVERGDDGSAVISWDGDAGALGLYVTEPGASLPLFPGQVVEGGVAYWVLEASNFPTGFASPVTYGTPPEFGDAVTEVHGGQEGAAALEAGRCYQFSVTRSDFQTGNVVLRW